MRFLRWTNPPLYRAIQGYETWVCESPENAGGTLLHYAATEHLDEVLLYACKQPDQVQIDRLGRRPLTLAFRKRYLKGINLFSTDLLTSGDTWNDYVYGLLFLHRAGHLDLLKKVLRPSSKNVEQDWTRLMALWRVSLSEAFFPLCHVLIDVISRWTDAWKVGNFWSILGCELLVLETWADDSRHADLVAILDALIVHGFDVNEPTPSIGARPPFNRYVVESCPTRWVFFLMNQHRYSALRASLSRGASPNTSLDDKIYPLALALHRGNIYAAQDLLESGAEFPTGDNLKRLLDMRQAIIWPPTSVLPLLLKLIHQLDRTSIAGNIWLSLAEAGISRVFQNMLELVMKEPPAYSSLGSWKPRSKELLSKLDMSDMWECKLGLYLMHALKECCRKNILNILTFWFSKTDFMLQEFHLDFLDTALNLISFSNSSGLSVISWEMLLILTMWRHPPTNPIRTRLWGMLTKKVPAHIRSMSVQHALFEGSLSVRQHGHILDWDRDFDQGIRAWYLKVFADNVLRNRHWAAAHNSFDRMRLPNVLVQNEIILAFFVRCLKEALRCHHTTHYSTHEDSMLWSLIIRLAQDRRVSDDAFSDITLPFPAAPPGGDPYPWPLPRRGGRRNAEAQSECEPRRYAQSRQRTEDRWKPGPQPHPTPAPETDAGPQANCNARRSSGTNSGPQTKPHPKTQGRPPSPPAPPPQPAEPPKCTCPPRIFTQPVVCPFPVLNVSCSAPEPEVNRAFRAVSLRYHPDTFERNRHLGLSLEELTERMKVFNRAMEDIKDSLRRRAL